MPDSQTGGEHNESGPMAAAADRADAILAGTKPMDTDSGSMVTRTWPAPGLGVGAEVSLIRKAILGDGGVGNSYEVRLHLAGPGVYTGALGFVREANVNVFLGEPDSEYRGWGYASLSDDSAERAAAQSAARAEVERLLATYESGTDA